MGLTEIKCNDIFENGSVRFACWNYILVYLQIDLKKLFSLHVVCAI
jgi:hypothetical protein